MMMSSINRRLTYIEQTANLREGLSNHNQGAGGTNMTNVIQNCPWSFLVYIVGFDKKRCYMKSVEASWKNLIIRQCFAK